LSGNSATGAMPLGAGIEIIRPPGVGTHAEKRW